MATITDMIKQIGAEIDQENLRVIEPNDQMLHKIAQNLLLLERDLTSPGVSRSAEDRVSRLIEEIAKRSF